jgi:hypothetical protein
MKSMIVLFSYHHNKIYENSVSDSIMNSFEESMFFKSQNPKLKLPVKSH